MKRWKVGEMSAVEVDLTAGGSVVLYALVDSTVATYTTQNDAVAAAQLPGNPKVIIFEQQDSAE